MYRKKEFWHHVVLWLMTALLASIQIYLGHVKDPLDFLTELSILLVCISLLVEINRLKLGWLMGFGWALYTGSLLVDLIDEYYAAEHLEVSFDLLDDFLKIGFVFIGIAFFKVINEKRWLINSLQLEVEYRRELETQLNEVACLDELTQIGNRRAFFKHYNELVDTYNNPLLIFIDLDNFKQLNDTQGHQEGDELLKAFASSIAKQCTQQGVAYRFGGDEFVILYDAKQCQTLIEQIKEDMLPIFKQTKVSISYGAIEIDNQKSADEHILKVDQLMYKNKQQRKSLRKTSRST
ncbi:GGDEF domain-containing protein [Psychromonas sp. psych-6C06]|uniref:GGDEF domain-containing protein n=1 Tax=Psychromonas sp. psych-6C06 TaxID=2058089 RepID=UPI00187C9D2E|nr:GGDEF domain-containing protein [Psychromonas sp. psych-6C06]